MNPRGMLVALLVAAASTAASCHASPPEPPPAPSATAPSAPPPELVALPLDAAAAPSAVPTARPKRPPDPFTLAYRAWEERMRLPLISEDARLVAIDPRLHGGGSDHVAELEIIDVDSDLTRQRFDVPPGSPAEVVLARLAEAAAALDGQTWSTLTPYPQSAERTNDFGVKLETEVTGDGLVVQFRQPTLTVREVGGRTLFRRALPHLSFGRTKDCTYSSSMLEVWGSRRLGVLVVELEHNGFPYFCGIHESVRMVRFAPRAR